MSYHLPFLMELGQMTAFLRRLESTVHPGGFFSRCSSCSQHAPVHRFASWATSRGLPTFGSPWASCSHLVLSNSSQFASFFFVHLPLRFRLTPRITQRVPIPFQHRARAVNPYPIIRF